MSTELDLSRTSGLISEGTHLFKITGGKEQASKTSGEPMWVLECTCQDAGEDQGKKMSLFLSLTPQARFKIDQLLDAIEAPKQGKIMVEQLPGKLLKIAVIHDEYQGAVQMKAYKMLPASSTAEVSLPSGQSSQGSTASELSGQPQRKKIF